MRQVGAYLAVLASLMAAVYLAIHDLQAFPLGFGLTCLLLAGPIWLLRLKRNRILVWLGNYEPVAWKIVKTTS